MISLYIKNEGIRLKNIGPSSPEFKLEDLRVSEGTIQEKNVNHSNKTL